MEKSKPQIVVIVGSTASGKSDLAVKLAKKFNGEIISADSRQVYQGMDIGTGKITRKKMMGIPHHLLDVASPKKQFTVAQYQNLGKTAIKKILKKGKLPIIVGGTGFYIEALINDTALPEVKKNIKLRAKLDKKLTQELFKQLQKIDPRRAQAIDPHNKRRLIRALEIVLTTGKPVPKMKGSSKYQVITIGIKTSENKLKESIKQRLLKRLRQGMIQEVKNLHKQGISWKRLDNFGLEYRWISRYLRGQISKEEMITKLEIEIWHYAKRQITWFKRDINIHWINNSQKSNALVKKFLK